MCILKKTTMELSPFLMFLGVSNVYRCLSLNNVEQLVEKYWMKYNCDEFKKLMQLSCKPMRSYDFRNGSPFKSQNYYSRVMSFNQYKLIHTRTILKDSNDTKWSIASHESSMANFSSQDLINLKALVSLNSSESERAQIVARINLCFGVQKEKQALSLYEQVTSTSLEPVDKNIHYKIISQQMADHKIYLCGKVDGICGDVVIEIKNRIKPLTLHVYENDYMQSQLYMYLYNKGKTHLTQCFWKDKTLIDISVVEILRNNKFLEVNILPNVINVGIVFSNLIRQASRDEKITYLSLTPEKQREYIKNKLLTIKSNFNTGYIPVWVSYKPHTLNPSYLFRTILNAKQTIKF